MELHHPLKEYISLRITIMLYRHIKQKWKVAIYPLNLFLRNSLYLCITIYYHTGTLLSIINVIIYNINNTGGVIWEL